LSLAESLPRPEPRPYALAAALAVGVFLSAWVLLHVGFYTHGQVKDTPVYERYGNAIVRGEVPYRDFGVEYPPGALPAFALPALGHDEDGRLAVYETAFQRLMVVCGVAAVLLTALALRGLSAGLARTGGALAFVALAPLALGSVVLSRFDLWPAAVTAAALAALVSGRLRVGHAVLGLAVAIKIYPAVLVPLAVAYAWRRGGRREAAASAAWLVAAVAAVFVPFLALSPGGVWDSVVRQSTRPLQIESLGASLLVTAHHVFGTGATMSSSHGSQNLAGGGADAIAAVQSAAQLAAIVAVWIWFARGPGGREEFVRACAAALVAFVALGKVLSPQFLIWLVPLVPLVRGRRGLTATALLGTALVLTQLWFPFRYWRYALQFDETASWLVLGRDLVLLALLAVLALPLRRRDSGDGDSHRLARGRAAARVALDQRALDPHVPLGGREPDRDAGAHAADRQLRLHPDH
jgi:hypothetical protein